MYSWHEAVCAGAQDGLGLAAEHGFFFRGAGSLEWDQRSNTEDMAWQARARHDTLGGDADGETQNWQDELHHWGPAASGRHGCPALAAAATSNRLAR